MLQDGFSSVHDIAWSRSPFDLTNYVGVPAQLRELVAANGYDVIHVHSATAALALRFALRKLSRPRIVYTANGFRFHEGGGLIGNALHAMLERMAGPWTDELIVVNTEDHAAALRLRLVPTGHLHLLPGSGIDLSRFPFDPLPEAEIAARRRALDLPADLPLVLMVADFVPRKRHEDALAAFSAVWSGAHLLLVGSGPLEDEMRQQAASLGLGRRVHFLGQRPDVPELLAISQLLLLPSLREGLPAAVLEAMAMGVPVIGTDIRGTRDLLADGSGVLVPVKSPAALAHAMNALLADRGHREMLRSNARDKIGQYALGPLLEEHARLYSRLRDSVRRQAEAEAEAMAASQRIP